MSTTAGKPAALDSVSCELCGGRDSLPLYPSLEPIAGCRLVRCSACGLHFINPRRSPADEREFYRSEYYDCDHKSKEHLSRLALFKAYVERIRRHVPSGALLDVGCGLGHFIRFAGHAGYEVHGVEVSDRAVRMAGEFLPGAVRLGTLAEAAFPPASMNVVTFFNVLDQLPDPLDTLRITRGLLKPGGLMLARVPNALMHHRVKRLLDRMGRLTDRYRLHQWTTFHLYQFTPATIETLCRKAGFDRVVVLDSPVSRGDPSGKSSGFKLLAVTGAKAIYGSTARAVAGITSNRLLIGTSIDAYAFKAR